MITFKKRIAAIMLVCLFATATMVSCSKANKEENGSEVSADSTEHPSDSAEHPSDSTEHPAGEHPKDSTNH